MGMPNYLGLAILIITIFILINLFLTLSIGLAHIENNWDDYKCKPEIVPFASFFGKNPKENFDECVKLYQVDFMEVFLAPIYQSLYYFAQHGTVFTKLFENMKLFGNSQDFAMGNFVDTVKQRFYSVTNATNLVFIKTFDTFSKLTSTITVMFQTIKSGLEFGRLSWDGLLGYMVRQANNAANIV